MKKYEIPDMELIEIDLGNILMVSVIPIKDDSFGDPTEEPV